MVIVSKQLTAPSTGKQLSDYAEGDIIKIPENGTPVEFYVAKHDYESGLNGKGRTLVVRKDCYDRDGWGSSNVNAWASCSMRSHSLNNIYKALLDNNIQSLMGATKYYYTLGNGNNSVTTRSDAVFLLSATELGASFYFLNVEGSALPIASTLKIAYLNGSATTQWTRSPDTRETTNAWYLNTRGSYVTDLCYYMQGCRPVFTLPSTTKFDPDTNIIIG